MFSKGFSIQFFSLTAFVVFLSSHQVSAQWSDRSSNQGRTLAQSKTPPSAATGTEKPSDKLDVTDLERKYWAAKDTDFSVVQNRTYTKANRVALSASYGIPINDQFSDGTVINGALNYYFSERLGIEASYSKFDLADNDAVAFWKAQNGAMPDHNKIRQFYGASLNWVPFYAKVSVLNKQIIYYDLAISPGVGLTEYEAQFQSLPARTESAVTGTLDVTQTFFINKRLAFRLDYKNRWFSEKIFKAGVASGPAAPGTQLRTNLNHQSMLLFGVQYFF